MSKLERGLYEQLVTGQLERALRDLDARLEPETSTLHPEEAADRISLHLGRLLRQAIASLESKHRPEQGALLARKIVELLLAMPGKGVDPGDAPVAPASVLRSLLRRLPDGTREALLPPVIPLLDTTLLTNAPGEPRVGVQLQSEIVSADRIDVLMAFVRRSGIRPLLAGLRRHTQDGRPLRLLTTTYTQSTELAALEALRDAGAEIRVSYDTSGTRLHAKAWLFHRASGFSTAFIGSSNLTHSAQVTGLEWNVRVSGARNPDVVDKFSAVFDSYWESTDFRPFDAKEYQDFTRLPERNGPQIYLSPVEIRPEPFQARLLDQIALSRKQGYHRNLLAAATGTGKTVMAALDYQRLRPQLPRSRLLFVAHRKEILDQSLATFRHALRDAAFGERWVDGARPTRFEHVFASIQSLSAVGYEDMAPDHFDVVIIDEFHHAAAATYTALLGHIRPIELLGLTATPERSDGLMILKWFDHRIAAELRLWDAIDQHRLCPFAYFGFHDGIDLRAVQWHRGSGYNVNELSNLVTGNHVWVRRVLKAIQDQVDNPGRMRALGFCVSIAHARFMAAEFTRHGLPSVAVWSDSDSRERADALSGLADGTTRVVFSVDLFNEGVDVPRVDTLLLLRPTDSPTLFLQQLGRGLRRYPGKNQCTVLDFVGHHRKEFRFDRRIGALLRGNRKALAEQVEQGFPFLPAGCHMSLDAVAEDIVLRSIRESLPSNWPQRVEELVRCALEQPDLTLLDFLEASGLALDDVYTGNRCWSDLREAASLETHARGAHEDALRRALGRMLHIDDRERIDGYRSLLRHPSPPSVFDADERTARVMSMLVVSLVDRAIAVASLQQGLDLLWQHPQVRAELVELLEVLARRVDHVHLPLQSHPAVPLQVHACYSRLEILAAFANGGTSRPLTWREGVRWLPDAQVDLFAFTLDKTSGHFSPTTRYRDFAISRDLIHWESQSSTRSDSDTGRRYRNHVRMGTTVLLFARLHADDRAFWFLGPATYVSHEGERPMAIKWRLQHPLPGDLYAQFAAAVA
ncbi:MAG: DUF3427 domain-containing protein [Rhodanobacteraceae bacterium]|nr:DUF3427 domain-containing protein [Rhodanobacteraceae bacterium]